MDSSLLNQINHLKDIISTGMLDKNIFLVEETSNSPFVYLNPVKGMIIIKGDCRPPDVYEFFQKILDFIESKFKNTKDMEGHFLYTYFNSSSGKLILDIVKILSGLSRNGNNVECYWYYEKNDGDMLSAGEEISRIARIPFKFSEVEDIQAFFTLKFD
jgi:hypothetical protein